MPCLELWPQFRDGNEVIVSTTTEPASRRLTRGLLSVLSLVAAGIAGYLLVLALGKQGLPVGCGDESGCAEVLTSRWSVVFGVPVSGPALVVYLAVFCGTLVAARPTAQRLLMACGVMMLLAAIWFTVLQFFVLEALCPWCLTEHALGLVMAMLIFSRPWPRLADATTSSSSSLMSAALVGCVAFVAFIGAQFMSSPPKTTIRLPEGQNADTGPGPDRQLAVLQGKLQLVAADEPMLGSPDANKLLCVMFDYCCPHCRKTHGYLKNALAEFPNDLAIISLPMPRDADCNPSIEITDDRFEHACELAELSLAVWHANPNAFAEFDSWLFETSKPRPPDEARAKAESLVGADELTAALADPFAKSTIARNIEAYTQSQAESIPVLMSPGFASIVGRPESEEALMQVLKDELFANLSETGAPESSQALPSP